MEQSSINSGAEQIPVVGPDFFSNEEKYPASSTRGEQRETTSYEKQSGQYFASESLTSLAGKAPFICVK